MNGAQTCHTSYQRWIQRMHNCAHGIYVHWRLDNGCNVRRWHTELRTPAAVVSLPERDGAVDRTSGAGTTCQCSMTAVPTNKRLLRLFSIRMPGSWQHLYSLNEPCTSDTCGRLPTNAVGATRRSTATA